MKQYIYWALIFSFLLLSLILSRCISGIVKGTNENTQKRFLVAKNYIYNVFFEGIVVKKEFHEQKQNSYSIDILLKNIHPIPDTGQQATFFSYYSFINDSLLNLCINKNIYEYINVKDTIIKGNNDYNIQVNGERFPLLNKSKNQWFP